MQQRLRLSLTAWRRLAKKLRTNHVSPSPRDRLLYAIHGAVNSLLFRIQDASHAEALKKALPHSPVFLFGFWRSGTTFLHELFCCDSRFGFPSTYACLNPAHFLLSEKAAGKTAQEQARRPMDNMKYSWASPQEDEFALLALGAPSPYEALIAPSLLRDPGKLLDLRQGGAEDVERWSEAIQYFLRLLTVQQAKPMVLKSPSHGFRLPLLLSLFPHARYVIIDRNPYEVYASNIKLWQTLIGLYGLEAVALDVIQEFVLTAYQLHEKIIAEVSISPAALLARVRYEDLLADAAGQMRRLYAELQLSDFESSRPRIQQYLAGVADHKRNKFRITAAEKERIDMLWGEFLRSKGYDWPDRYIEVVP